MRGDNIVLPLVGKDTKKIGGMLAGFKNEGYTAHLVFMDLPIKEAAARAVTRLIEKKRWVDPEYVLSIRDFPSQTYEALKGQFKSYVKYSNDVSFGNPPKVIEDSGN